MNEATFVMGFHNEDQVKKMQYTELGATEMRLSRMALGGGPLGGLYEPLEEAEGISIVKNALINGVNYIDTAPWYGQGKSEALLGKALKEVPRSAYYIGTKVGRYETDVRKMFDFSAERVFRSVDESLRLLGLDYVDIIQVHDVEFAPSVDLIINETLPAVEKIVKQGKARFIGVTGYPLSTLKEIIEKSTVKIDSVLSYTRNTLIDDELSKYIPFFQEKNIGIIDAALLGMGLLSNGGPQAWHPARDELKERAKKAAHFCQENGCDIAHLALQHSFSQSDISTFVIGCGSMETLLRNLSSVTSRLPEKEKELTQLVRERFFTGDFTKNWEQIDVDNYWQKMSQPAL